MEISAFVHTFSGKIQKVEIFDEAGNVLQSEEISGPTTDFDVSALPVGVYFIRGEIGGKQITEKLIKQ